MSHQKVKFVNEFRKNYRYQQGLFFFDNFTSFRFHYSPNLLASICLLNWEVRSMTDKLLQKNFVKLTWYICIHIQYCSYFILLMKVHSNLLSKYVGNYTLFTYLRSHRKQIHNKLWRKWKHRRIFLHQKVSLSICISFDIWLWCVKSNRKKQKETDGKLLKTTLTKNNGGKDWSNLPKPKSLR